MLSFTNLISEWDGEIQHLAVQLPFSLVLHVRDLNFNCNRTLSDGKIFSSAKKVVNTNKLIYTLESDQEINSKS